MIGGRIRFKEKRGTIKYIGPVATDSSGRTWLGVEWDRVGDGIHDGSVKIESSGEIVRYFSCQEKKGSFVKSDKVSLAITFTEAYQQKYATGNQVAIVAAKERTEADIAIAGLAGTNLGSASDSDDLTRQYAFIHVLDVSDTLFASWNDLFLVASKLPELKELVACTNGGLEIHDNCEPMKISKLVSLSLNDCMGIDFRHLTQICSFSHLKELRLSKCGLISVPDSLPTSLNLLDLSLNEIRLLDLESLQRLPSSLENLNLSGNPLTIQTGLDIPRLETLHKLNVDKTAITSFEEVETLDMLFPYLVDLRLWHCPLSDELIKRYTDVDKCRARFIVRMPSIITLNGTEVGVIDRREAELICLKSLEVFKRRDEVIRRLGWEEENTAKPTINKISIIFEHKGVRAERKMLANARMPAVHSIFCRLFQVSNSSTFNLKIDVSSPSKRSFTVDSDDRFTLADFLNEDEREIIIQMAQED